MPAPLATALLVFGAILSNASVTAGIIVAALGLAVELFVFYTSGLDAR